ncbi:MAG: plasmid pRiA4b ORF-3 family protein [Spirochaetaceae bacterium]|jgi:hypothetical protein|nr:plasmid pRiA4b ORF-3 family protein [Spirochaetaceae bacterium]
MTVSQEDAFYEFLENVTEPFSLEDIVAFVRMIDSKGGGRLASEIASFIDFRNIAFPLGTNRWISRRGCFEPVRFVISPTRLELLNGILIPGHRCVPFANPVLLPQEYAFYWRGSPISASTTEGPPDDFYPYYSLFGEEYAPQYVARDNPDNESAFNSDPYDDPPEVSIHTLDMRNIYRETAAVPGDRFVVKTLDWKAGIFELERVDRDEWSQADLYAWFEAAEGGFEDAFKLLGPGGSTEEQIAYAYWYGGKRMREVPAYALEDFLYEKTDRIETAVYGIETRFWYAGKEIPDAKGLEENQILPDRTVVENILYQKGVPISEYVIQSYVRDALFRDDQDIPHIIERIIPRSCGLDEKGWDFLAGYISDVFDDFTKTYTLFTDKAMGPIRQRVGELHTAVIDLAARLNRGDIDRSCLPKHTFVILSQIQGHASSVLEDLDSEEPPSAAELEAMDNSLDSMIETYEDIKEMIDGALDSFRRNNISVVKDRGKKTGWTIQISVGGTDVWRRIIVPESYCLEELHLVIQALFNWTGIYGYQFALDRSSPDFAENRTLGPQVSLGELHERGCAEFLYEYGTKWTVKIMILSRHDLTGKPVRCVAGTGAPPPECIDGPLRFRKFLSALEGGNDAERNAAKHELGQDFDAGAFDIETCNRTLAGPLFKKQEPIKMDSQ